MSESKLLTPLEVVKRYYQRYLEYEKAFNENPFTEKQRQEEVVKIAQSGIDLESDEFMDKMIEAMVDKPQKVADVANSAAKFLMFTEFYILTQEEELPKEIVEDYKSLPIKEDIKSNFSIKDGKFIRNEKLEITQQTRDYFRNLIEEIKTRV